MSLTATCGVVRTAGSRGASMLAVMWWVAPWTGGVVRLRHEPLDRTKPLDCLKRTDSPPTAASTSLLRPRSRGPIAHITEYGYHRRHGNPGHPASPAARRGLPTCPTTTPDLNVRRPAAFGLRRGYPCPPCERPGRTRPPRPRAPTTARRAPAAPTGPPPGRGPPAAPPTRAHFPVRRSAPRRPVPDPRRTGKGFPSRCT